MQWGHSRRQRFGFYLPGIVEYINTEVYEKFSLKLDEIGAKLYKLYENWKTF